MDAQVQREILFFLFYGRHSSAFFHPATCLLPPTVLEADSFPLHMADGGRQLNAVLLSLGQNFLRVQGVFKAGLITIVFISQLFFCISLWCGMQVAGSVGDGVFQRTSIICPSGIPTIEGCVFLSLFPHHYPNIASVCNCLCSFLRQRRKICHLSPHRRASD